MNSDRWYAAADRLGIVVFQDAPQKYGGATAATVAPFMAELTEMLDQRHNTPSIIQWEVRRSRLWEGGGERDIGRWGAATTASPRRLSTRSHPRIDRTQVFNEGDCVAQFNATAVTEYVVAYDPTRLVDTNR